MKIKLCVSQNHYEQIEKQLIDKGIEIDENADLILTEKNAFISFLSVKDKDEKIKLPVDKILYIEAFGKDIEVHTLEKVYLTSERLYQLYALLDPSKFLRISHSVIIAKDKIKKITPRFSMRFTLTMLDEKCVDVTRSYYQIFKDEFHI